MVTLTLEEAQLFRMLADFFGAENVIPRMSVVAACGGKLPDLGKNPPRDLERWARRSKCLFTIVDAQDSPRMVVEFFSGFAGAIDADEAEHQRFLPRILEAAGVRYVTISRPEFSEIIDPDSSLDLRALLESKVLSTPESLEEG